MLKALHRFPAVGKITIHFLGCDTCGSAQSVHTMTLPFHVPLTTLPIFQRPHALFVSLPELFPLLGSPSRLQAHSLQNLTSFPTQFQSYFCGASLILHSWPAGYTGLWLLEHFAHDVPVVLSAFLAAVSTLLASWGQPAFLTYLTVSYFGISKEAWSHSYIFS